MKLEDFEKYLQKRLRDHQANDLDPSSIWANVASELPQKGKRSFYWWGLCTAVLLIFSILIILNKGSVAIPNTQKTTPINERRSSAHNYSNNETKIIDTSVIEHSRAIYKYLFKKGKASLPKN